jgi:hypothetical protein
VTLTYRMWYHHERVVIRNIIWRFHEEILRNGKVIANVKFWCIKLSTKRGITPSNVTLTLRIWYHFERVVISNIIYKFDEEILRNGKVIANVKFSWRTDGPPDGRTKWSLCITISSKGRHKKGHNSIKCDLDLRNIVLSRGYCHRVYNLKV